MNTQPLAVAAVSRQIPYSPVWRRAFAFVFTRPLALGIGTAVFAAVGLALVFGSLTVHDEGLLTYVFAHWLVLDPLPVLFFQKVKPVVSLVYAVPSLAGPEVTLAVHVLLAALVAPMLAAVARALGVRLPNLPALIVLTSTPFLFGAASGVSSVDGVVATTAFLFLAIAVRRQLLAGIVLGCLPWVRSELAPLALVLWVYFAAIERNRAIALGAMVFPIAYALAGAAYHRDVLWLLHFPPATKFPMPGNPIWDTEIVGPRYLLATWLSITPIVGLALAVRPSRVTGIERALFLGAALSILLLNLLPVLRLGNFGASPRYSMQPLPILALLAARAVEPWLGGRRASWRVFLLPAILAAIWAVSVDVPLALAVATVSIYVAIAVFASLAWGRAAACAMALAACIGLALFQTEMTTPDYVKPALRWLSTHPQEAGGAEIYTNSPEVSLAITRAFAAPQARFIVGPDTMWEINELSNAENGQRAALERRARTDFFTASVLWNEITPDTMSPRSLLVLRDDPRLPLLLPDSVWAGRTEDIGRGDDFAIRRVLPAGAAQARLGETSRLSATTGGERPI